MRSRALFLAAAIVLCTTQAFADQPGKRTIETPAGTVIVSPKPGHSVEDVLKNALAGAKHMKRVNRLSTLESEVATLRKEVAMLRQIATDAGFQASPDVPTLLSPKAGIVVQNGTDRFDSSVDWDFRWTPVKDADSYQFFVIRRDKHRPAIDKIVKDTKYRHVQAGTWNSGTWYLWRVRALRDGKPLPWSDFRTFDVEPMRFVEQASQR